MRVTSPAFRDGEQIPSQYSRYGDDKSPPLQIEGVPMAARSLVLIVDDPDAPRGLFTHWIVFNLSPKTTEIREDHAPETPARQGANGWGETQYGGPRPPSGEHRYFFHLFALDTVLNLPRGTSRADIDRSIEGHVIAEAQLIGRFSSVGEPAQR